MWTAMDVAHDVALNIAESTTVAASPVRLPANMTTGVLDRLQADGVGALGSVVRRGTFVQSMYDRVFASAPEPRAPLVLRTRSYATMIEHASASATVYAEEPTGFRVPSPVSAASSNDSADALREDLQSNGVTTRGSSAPVSRANTSSPPLHDTSHDPPEEGFPYDPNGFVPFFGDELAALGIPYPLRPRPAVGERLFKKFYMGASTAWCWHVGTVLEVLEPCEVYGCRLRVEFDHAVEFVCWPSEYTNRGIGFPHFPHPDSASFPFGRDSDGVLYRGSPVWPD